MLSAAPALRRQDREHECPDQGGERQAKLEAVCLRFDPDFLEEVPASQDLDGGPEDDHGGDSVPNGRRDPGVLHESGDQRDRPEKGASEDGIGEWVPVAPILGALTKACLLPPLVVRTFRSC